MLAAVDAFQVANGISARYDKITGFFEDLDSYLKRLKILENKISPIPELQAVLTEVFTSVLALCGIYAKYIKMKRICMSALNESLLNIPSVSTCRIIID